MAQPASAPLPAPFQPPIGQRFPAALRLTLEREFDAVYAARLKKIGARLDVRAVPNGLPYWRLGLSISRRVGCAPQRVRWKRRIREAFRTARPLLPLLLPPCPTPAPSPPHPPSPPTGGMDIIVAVRSGLDPIGGTLTQELSSLCEQLHKEQQRRDRRREAQP